ncbi:glucan endo-1,3-beta-glucosidase 11-like [Nymphaea colorata]|nr:glucan endo-1,3-beta-glucosidase 11-like [Nymphaea colorata]XP_049935516.1 glucan endo-1,3-beta-glucosidase 11-like [Nymphaea colorata]
MAVLRNSFTVPPFSVTFLLLLHLFFSDSGLIRGVSSVGINYGQVANNLPSPDDVLTLLKSLKISKIRIYDTNPEILTSFANSNIDIIVTLGNQLVGKVVDPQQALDWVTTNIKPYLPATNISGISIGNEPFNSDDSLLMLNLAPAMASIHAALVQLGLGSSIQVSSANSLAILSNSFPPSAAAFREDLVGLITPMLQFLADTGSPFWINAYPYFAYKSNPTSVSLNYVLFEPGEGMVDPYTNLHYDNMLYAQVDAVIFAMARAGFTGVEVRVSETGWPSKGDAGEYGASLENAEAYNRNLLRRQFEKEGTPLRPEQSLEVYLFALFNENLKPGPTSERNYGLYRPDGSKAYDVGLN